MAMANIERVKDTIRKLLNLASDDAATEGEVNNAIRFARKLMLQHQLSEDECGDDSHETDEDRIGRAACQRCSSNSQTANASGWESHLSSFVCRFVGGVGTYLNTRQPRRINGILDSALPTCAIFTFYGVSEDAALAQRIFEELSVTIASMGRLKFGGAFKGPGREYCEGFVSGLYSQLKQADAEQKSCETTAIAIRRDALVRLKKDRADEWLKKDIGVSLRAGSARCNGSYNADARSEGKADGARTRVAGRDARIGQTIAALSCAKAGAT